MPRRYHPPVSLSRTWGRHSCLPTHDGRHECLPHRFSRKGVRYSDAVVDDHGAAHAGDGRLADGHSAGRRCGHGLVAAGPQVAGGVADRSAGASELHAGNSRRECAGSTKRTAHHCGIDSSAADTDYVADPNRESDRIRTAPAEASLLAGSRVGQVGVASALADDAGRCASRRPTGHAGGLCGAAERRAFRLLNRLQTCWVGSSTGCRR